MREQDQADLERLIQSIAESAKYRAVDRALIRDIGLRELAARRGFKEALKATKNKLHQVAGAYLDTRPQYDRWADMIAASVQSQNEGRLRAACLEIMRHHASTRERSGLLGSFYATTLADLRPIRSVLDVACGLNPLAIPWMPLEPEATYYACDIYGDLAAFLSTFFGLTGVQGRAETCDLIAACPRQRADVALVLKALPVLEQLNKTAGIELLRALNAACLLVSFPARSLGGRDKGMTEHYEARFLALVQDEGWQIERFDFPTELVFRVRKNGRG